MGYIDEGGEYHDQDEPGRWQRIWHPPRIFDDVRDYAEVAIDMRAQPILYGLSASEIAQVLWNEVRARHNWETLAEGAISFPVDILWFGYGVGAYSGQLGSTAEQRVKDTLATSGRLLAEAGGAVLHVGTGALSGIAQQTVAQGGISTTKLAFVANVILNHMVHGGSLHRVGRGVGGVITRYVVALVGTQLIGLFYPPARTQISAVANHPLLTQSLLYASKGGSIIRKGDLLLDRDGSLRNMRLADTVVTLLTGESDPEGVRTMMREINSSFRAMLSRLEYEIYETLLDRRLERDATDRVPEADVIWRRLGQEAGRLASSTFTYSNDEAFLDGAIRAHNLSVALYRAGYTESDIVNRMRTLGDPTLLTWARALTASMTSVLASLLNMPKEARWWDYMMQQELERRTNDPEYILGD